MAQDDLRRELGFWDALTIGAGTMIGAGIFLLAGVALELTGDVEDKKAALDDTVQGLVDTDRVEYLVRQSDSVTGGIDATLTEADYDFAIIGASREWSLRQVLFGSIPDVVADRADCSVLMVRRYVPNTLSVRAVEGVKRLKETVGLTTSPEE
ncbi:universal stress protein [Salinibacter ruber]|uniref:universal stress protein n=1 Tax=Salinibacter ruber TaxID=146919 RepID=UPI001F0785F6|nr:universal stress protein [Salinibacter ruber]